MTLVYVFLLKLYPESLQCLQNCLTVSSSILMACLWACFFTKIQKRIIDPTDPQQRWILWIMSKSGFLGYII